ncbi:C40 family peptidase [Candidatus Micrarchaeota archaeon]|nr:C40 family peptidase [Candidatus Micrarchaeota archaeon]
MRIKKEYLVALVIAALLIIISQQSPKPEDNESSTTLAPFTSTTESVKNQLYFLPPETIDLENTSLELNQSIKASDGAFSEFLNITNSGEKPVEFGILEIIPRVLGGFSDVTFVSTASRVQTLSKDPVVQYSEHRLGRGEKSSRQVNSRKTANSSVIHLFAPLLSSEERQRILPLLETVANLSFTPLEAKAVQQHLNKLMNENKTFEEKLNETTAYVRVLESMKSRNASDKNVSNLFPHLPDYIELTVSEENPVNSTSFIVESSFPIGKPLMKFEGDLTDYARSGYKELPENRFNVSLVVDLWDVDFVDGLLPLDGLEGKLVISFASLLYKEKEIPVLVSVVHKDLMGDYSEEKDALSYDDKLIQSPALTSTCQKKAEQVTYEAGTYAGRLNYVFGGLSLSSGTDCSGFMQLIYRKFGVSLPRTAAQQSLVGVPVNKENLYPGDLVFFKNTYKRGISHVGLYLGKGKYGKCTFVHAAGRKRGTLYSSLCSSYYVNHYAGARRVIPACVYWA